MIRAISVPPRDPPFYMWGGRRKPGDRDQRTKGDSSRIKGGIGRRDSTMEWGRKRSAAGNGREHGGHETRGGTVSADSICRTRIFYFAPEFYHLFEMHPTFHLIIFLLRKLKQYPLLLLSSKNVFFLKKHRSVINFY